MKKITSILLLLIAVTGQSQLINLSQLRPGANGSFITSVPSGTSTAWTATTSINWSKISSTPTTLSGYGITNAVTNTSSITINGTTKTFTSTPTFSTPLSQVLGIGNTVGGQDITSTDGDAYLQLTDGNTLYIANNKGTLGITNSGLSLQHTTQIGLDAPNININGATTAGSGSGGEIGVYSSHAYMTADFQSSTNIESNTLNNVFNHNVANRFNAPVNDFTGSIKKNSVEVATLNDIPAAQTLSISGTSLSISGGNTVTIPTTSTVGLVPSTRSITINGTAFDLSANRTWSVGDVTTTATQTLTNKTITSGTLTGTTTQSTTTLTGAIYQAKAPDVASSSTTSIGAINGNYAHITGTATINSFGTGQAGAEITTVFDNTLTITSSTNIIVPDGYNILTAANDVATWRSEGSGIWRLTNYRLASNTWYNFTTTFTGFSANPASYTYRYTLNGKSCTIYYLGANGTSNATSFTMTLPFAAANTVTQAYSCKVTDSGTSSAGSVRTRVNSNILDVYKGADSFGAFTSSGNKAVNIASFTYEIQ